MSDIFEKLLEKEELYMQDIIEIFESHNYYIVGLDDEDIREHVEKDIKEIAKAINHTYKISKLNFIWRQKVEQSKLNLSNQLDGVSKVISSVAEDIVEKNENTKFEKEKEEIEILLLQKNIGIYDINITQSKNGKYVIELYTKLCDDLTQEALKIQKVEDILSKVLKQKMKIQNQRNNINGEEKKSHQTYISEDKLTVSFGIAKTTKKNSEANGDSSLNLKLEDGKVLLAICDGMGSGKEAKNSSEFAIKMIKKLLGAGFDKETSIELINSGLAVKTDSKTFSTIDIAILDLYDENIEFIKNAACPTYIKSGKKVEIINAISLPAGMLNNAKSVVFDKNITNGDIIIMCSDGILEANKEAINKEIAMQELLQDISTDNPQKIAEIILKEAIDYDFGQAKDDMTVLVAKIGNNI